MTLPRIDITILNAGLMSTQYTVVPATKHEMTIQVKYLSTALLTILLLPLLRTEKVAAVARATMLTIVGSEAYMAKIKTMSPILDQLDDPKAFNQLHGYSTSRLLLVLFVSNLAELVKSDEILVNVVNRSMTKGTAFFH